MKSPTHYVRKLLRLMAKAETVTTREEARKVLRKTRKHQEKLEKLRSLLQSREHKGGGD